MRTDPVVMRHNLSPGAVMTRRIVCVGWAVCLALVWALAPAGTADAAPPNQSERTYVVQPGDTLSAIGARFGVAVESIMAANRLDDADLIYEGQQLVIPASQEEAGPPSPEPTPTSTQVYIVQPGDSLSTIGAHFGVNVEELMKANDLTDPDYLSVGQPLTVPTVNMPQAYPAPFSSVVLSPLPVVQGQTLVVRVELKEQATLSGEFDGRPLVFATDGTGGWALVGIHALQSVGSYTLTLRARPRHGAEAIASVPLRVTGGPYATEDIPLTPDRESLLDPKLVDAEQARLVQVWSQMSTRPLWEGIFRLPLEEQRVTSDFGTRRSYNGGPVSGFHSGTDLGSAEGTPIHAPAAGRVAFADHLDVRGNTVLIDHGLGVFSGYFHQSQIVVEVGQTVQSGDLIGYVGNTGLSSGAHLHWEMRVAGIAVDATQWTQMAIP
jgi:murein DD-endopeptidase MepM/ murein hydrolase activator NlpD